jgi:hypothetical protein
MSVWSGVVERCTCFTLPAICISIAVQAHSSAGLPHLSIYLFIKLTFSAVVAAVTDLAFKWSIAIGSLPWYVVVEILTPLTVCTCSAVATDTFITTSLTVHYTLRGMPVTLAAPYDVNIIKSIVIPWVIFCKL